MRKESLENRFLDKVSPEPMSGCWIWTGNISKYGYGYLSINDKNVRAHRCSYSLFVGEIPKDLYVCHTCDLRCCVNPRHLFLGTQRDNMKDMVAKGRASRVIGAIGENHSSAKLKIKDVIWLKELANNGISQKDLSR